MLSKIKKIIKKKLIQILLKEDGINDYTFNEDLSIDVFSHVDLSNRNLKELSVKFNKVHGGFNCSNNNLTSLKNAPNWVKSGFDCSNNKITSLEFGPKEVGGNFICASNKLSNLQFCPDTVANLEATNNEIDTLKYFPKNIYGNCIIRFNKIKNIDTLKRTNIYGYIATYSGATGFLSSIEEKSYYTNEEIMEKFNLDDRLAEVATLENSLKINTDKTQARIKI